MGRKSTLKRRRRAATFEVRCVGALEVLSIGEGDLKIEIGDSNKDRADAQHLIEEMLRNGYTLFVETADGPLRVTRFLPDEMAYVVAGTPDVVPEPDPPRPAQDREDQDRAGDLAALASAPEQPATSPAPKRGRKPRTVPVAGSRTTAIGRTAGG